ncbi:hypothetical protein Lfu02_14600 [Longispora fulva]|uniref:Uncharacterized protein n=1 Tax=Longispora fulva TaxID=619741 RepID=A0A8J7GMJ9_9ACTN|nr:hypothetical protein [Longispora fulva]MBG6140530.1 hypothetical protein [Longispora fulva]GIG57088.1 hypothetical protein Lfu02_14600 [Longispora fulva]
MTAEPRSVRVMADYDCDPLWLIGEGFYANVSPADPRLSLTADLAESLRVWAEEYTGTLNRSDPIASGFPTPEAEREFAARGEELARRVRAELSAEWTVFYFDESVREHREIG